MEKSRRKRKRSFPGPAWAVVGLALLAGLAGLLWAFWPEAAEAGAGTEAARASQESGAEAAAGTNQETEAEGPLGVSLAEDPVKQEELDPEPPVILGVQDQTVEEGDSISYRSGVTATDNVDGEVPVEVDASQVDLDEAGVYTVVYTAEDAAGNVARETARITVTAPDPGEDNREEMVGLAREAVEECGLEGLDSRDQLYAMFWYVKNHMTYTGDSDKTSQVNEAIRGFEEGQGDCFTYFSMLKAMMEEAGFETRDVTRLGGETRHF